MQTFLNLNRAVCPQAAQRLAAASGWPVACAPAPRPRRASRNGSALLAVMLISGILLLAATAMLALASNASFRMRRLAFDSKALSIAEAGIADTIGKLTTNYWHWQDATNAANFAEGSYFVISRTLPGGSVLLISTGTVGTVSRMTAVELLGTDRDRNDMLFSLDGAILSGGDVRFRTAAFTIRGNVHSNQEIISASGAQNGDFLPATGATNVFITAVGGIGNLQGTLQPGVTPRELPAFNFDSYRQLAIAGGIYLEGNQSPRHWNPRPANGIMYVNGNITISGDSSLVGTLVVNGNVTFENNYTQTAFAPGMPAVLSTGNVTMGNRGRIDGLVYAAVNVFINNNVDIDGGIISGGYTEINNSSDITHPSEAPDWDPLQPAVPPEVIVGGWLR